MAGGRVGDGRPRAGGSRRRRWPRCAGVLSSAAGWFCVVTGGSLLTQYLPTQPHPPCAHPTTAVPSCQLLARCWTSHSTPLLNRPLYLLFACLLSLSPPTPRCWPPVWLTAPARCLTHSPPPISFTSPHNPPSDSLLSLFRPILRFSRLGWSTASARCSTRCRKRWEGRTRRRWWERWSR